MFVLIILLACYYVNLKCENIIFKVFNTWFDEPDSGYNCEFCLV